MKPKRRVYCPQCHRPKMAFETQEKALRFIHFNGPEIGDTLRAYHCSACAAWHITSKPPRTKKNNTIMQTKEMTLIEIVQNMVHYVETNDKYKKDDKHRSLIVIAAEGDKSHCQAVSSNEAQLIAALATQYVNSKKFRTLIERMVAIAKLTPEYQKMAERSGKEQAEGADQEGGRRHGEI